MTNAKYTVEEIAAALATVLEGALNGQSQPASGSSPKATRGRKAAPVADVPEEDETDADEQSERRAELEGKTIAALRKLAVAAGFDKDEVKDAEKEEIIESLLDDDEEEDEDEDEADDEADEEEPEDDEEEDEGDAELDRDGLMELGLRELKAMAKEEAELTAADMKGWDKEQVVDAILGEGAEDDDEEEDDAPDDEEEYTEDDLNEMSIGELKTLAKEWGVRLRPGMRQPAIVAALLEDDE